MRPGPQLLSAPGSLAPRIARTAPPQAERRVLVGWPSWRGCASCGLRGWEGRGAILRQWVVLQESQSLLPSWVGGLELYHDPEVAQMSSSPSSVSGSPWTDSSSLWAPKASFPPGATRWEEDRLPRPNSLQPRAFACHKWVLPKISSPLSTSLWLPHSTCSLCPSSIACHRDDPRASRQVGRPSCFRAFLQLAPILVWDGGCSCRSNGRCSVLPLGKTA